MNKLLQSELKQYIELGRREHDVICRTCHRVHVSTWGFINVEKVKSCFCAHKTFVRVYCPYCRYSRYEDKMLFCELLKDPEFQFFCQLRTKYNKY